MKISVKNIAEIEQHIKQEISKKNGYDISEIQADKNIAEYCDELDIAEIIEQFRHDFFIEIPDDIVSGSETINKLTKYVAQQKRIPILSDIKEIINTNISVKEFILKELNKNPIIFTYIRSYIYPAIPEEKLLEAKKCYNLTQNEEILWLNDTSFSGSAKENIIITQDSLYQISTFLGETSKIIIEWSKLIRVEYQDDNKKYYFVFSETDIDKNILIHSLHYHKKEMPAYIELLNHIAQFVKNAN